MISKAQLNAEQLKYNNVEFRLGDIEMITIADVVVSNCVINLIANKAKAFSEIHRILKVSGHFRYCFNRRTSEKN